MSTFTLVATFAALLLLATAPTTARAEGLSEGTYKLLDASGTSSCPDTVTIRSADEELSASDISLGGVRCTGVSVILQDERAVFGTELAEYIPKVVVVEVREGDITCGSDGWTEGETVIALRFSNIEAAIEEGKAILEANGFVDIDIGLKDDVNYIFTKNDEQICWFEWGSLSSLTGGDGDDDSLSTDDPTPATSNTTECFPAHARVRLHDGSVKPMSMLRTGDRVQVGAHIYSPIFAWTHASPSVISVFVTLWHATSSTPLSVTPGHFVYTADGALVAARDLDVGHMLALPDGSASPIVKRELRRARGLFNPQTLHGDIVVDGVRASTYTLAIPPKAAHALLSPVRAAFSLFDAVRGVASSSKV